MDIQLVDKHASHGGQQQVFRHFSRETGTEMTFAVFTPPQATRATCPGLIYLSGLTCTHANVMEKGEYRKAAAEAGLFVVCPDTSPRGADVADSPDYDLGQGAGFYLDATQKPWAPHFRMESYIARELPELLGANFPLDRARLGLTGHSMGGHGAITLSLKHPAVFRSCSAFAPISVPSRVPWGRKAFSAYLGQDERSWADHDAVALIASGKRVKELLVDQGDADPYLSDQLRPDLLKEACERAGIALTWRNHAGYDHSYYFISTVMADHIAWHAERLSH
jgi:S-formylglutathione hydrolase